ncbi:MAG: 5'-nucleotidase C-terminal domain-containing protein [Defluviitaleaceae bacterium]|nr:5'-nucleotidase C-terminal domain-containing protein [Defluviitaleaceae bacterium]
MKKASKILSVILALCLALPLLPFAAIAETDNAADAPSTYEESYEAPARSNELDGKTVIIYTANLRGNIDILPQVAALRAAYHLRGADTVLADLGNYLQGTIYSAYDSGRTIIELMDKAGYDVVAIGSREFDFGTGTVGVETHGIIYDHDSLGYLLDEASFQAVASNIVAGEDALYAFGANAVVVTASGREVGFFGLTNPDTVNQVLESNLEGLTFLDPETVAAEQAAALADSDLVIGLSNVGAPLFTRGAMVLDVYAGAGLTIGVVVLDNETNQVLAHSLMNPDELEADEDVAEAVLAAREAVHEEFEAWVVSEVTFEGSFAASRSGETNTGNLWANALRWFALEGGMVNFFDEDDIDAGNDRLMVAPENVVAIWNGGNLRDFLNAGHVTMNDVRRVLPFPNRVAVMYLTGAQLLEMLEAATQGLPFTGDTFAAAAAFPHVAGIEFTVDTTIPFDAGEAYGNHWFRANSIRRVTIDSINGNAFDPAATYAIITSNAIFNGMDSNYISLERDEEFSTITSAFVVDVVWMYIMQELGGVIGAEYAQPQGNITIITASDE